MGPNRTAQTAERWPGQRLAGTSPDIPRDSGSTGQRTARRWRPRSRPSPWVPWRLGQRNCCPTFPAKTHPPPASRNAHADDTPHGGAAIRRCGGAAGRRRRELRPPSRSGADRGKHTRVAARRTPSVTRHTPRAHPRQGRGRRHTPFQASAGGGTGAADSRLPGHPTRPRRRVPVARPDQGPLDCLAQHRQARSIPAPVPHRLAAGAHPGLLYVGGPLAASSPATHHRRPQQEAGTRVGQPPRTSLEPRPGGAPTGRVAGRHHQGHGCPGPPHGATHACSGGSYPSGGAT